MFKSLKGTTYLKIVQQQHYLHFEMFLKQSTVYIASRYINTLLEYISVHASLNTVVEL